MIYTNSPSLTGTSYLVAGLLGTELFELLFLTVFCYLQFVMVALAVFCAHLQSLDIDHPHAMAAILNICQVNITVYLFYLPLGMIAGVHQPTWSPSFRLCLCNCM